LQSINFYGIKHHKHFKVRYVKLISSVSCSIATRGAEALEGWGHVCVRAHKISDVTWRLPPGKQESLVACEADKLG